MILHHKWCKLCLYSNFLFAPGIDGDRRHPPSGTAHAPLLIGHQHGCGDGDRRVGTDQDSYDESEGEPTKYFAPKQIQRKHGQKRKPGGQNGPAKGLVNAFVNNLRQALTPQQLHVFTNAVKDHNRVVHGVTDQRQDGGNNRKAYLRIRQGESADGDQGIVKNGHHRGHAVDQLKAEPQINQHSQQRVKYGQPRLFLELGADLRAHNLHVAHGEIRDKEVVLQSGNNFRRGYVLELIEAAQHTALYAVAIVDDLLRFRQITPANIHTYVQRIALHQRILDALHRGIVEIQLAFGSIGAQCLDDLRLSLVKAGFFAVLLLIQGNEHFVVRRTAIGLDECIAQPHTVERASNCI